VNARIKDSGRFSCYDERGGAKVRSRSLGIVFIAAVIVPSILLAVLAIRAAGREEAFIERQLAATLGADVTHTAAMALAEVNRVTEELGAGVDVPSGSDYARILAAWKKSDPLVSVPFFLSSRYRILWPRSDARLDADQKRFLQENGDFLNDRAATSVLQNIAVRYQAEILAETARTQTNAPEAVTMSARGSTAAAEPASGPAPEAAASPAESTAAPGLLPSGTAGGDSRAAEVAAAPPSAGSAAGLRARDSLSSGLADESQAAQGAASAAALMPRSTVAAQMPRSTVAANAAPAAARQVALDAFAQSADIQNKVYEIAREKGDTVSPRVVQPTAPLAQNPAPAPASPAPQMSRSTAAGTAALAPALQGGADEEAAAEAQMPRGTMTDQRSTVDGKAVPTDQQMPRGTEAATTKEKKDTSSVSSEQLADQMPRSTVAAESGSAAAAPEAKPTPFEARKETAPVPRNTVAAQMPRSTVAGSPAQPSQYVITSQLLSEIASTGDHGLIPRFIGEKLVFLFWEREKDGRIAGCELAGSAFRVRIGGTLTATFTPQRILTLLDENGNPLAAPPNVKALDWRRPFVSEPIGETLPRWEAAAYLTTPDSIAEKARSSSLVIWILVLILFVSVAGGGSMVLSSVYGEMRLAQKKATFVTNVSHELKTPLTSISLFVELLRRKRPVAQAKREQYLSLMASETERLTRLINNVLDFSSLQRGAKRYTLRTLDAAVVAAETLLGQRVRLESRGFAVHCQTGSDELQVRADPEALKQVLLNLLTNAEKYSADRKEISVEVTPGQGQDGAVLLRVRDRGIGIAEKDRERIFREFYRVNDSLASGVQGTGLGLTIARRIVRDLGGDITCEPREGGGSDFIVRLPRARAEEEAE
jgi:signal transduction histidine kinase